MRGGWCNLDKEEVGIEAAGANGGPSSFQNASRSFGASLDQSSVGDHQQETELEIIRGRALL